MTGPLSIRDVLALPIMRSARVVGGERGLDDRTVDWIAVIEGPPEDFVLHGELILTSGIGCDGEGLARLVEEVCDSGAAGMCVGVGRGRFIERVGGPSAEVADARGFPLVEIPWEVRFSDVTRAVVQHLLAQRHAGGSDAGRAQFMSVVLDGRGFRGVAAVLDAALSRAVVILDHEFRPQAFGHKALVSLGDSGVADCRRAGDELSQEDVDQLGLLFSEESPGPVPELVPLGLGPGLGLAVTARSRVVAYLHAFEYGDSNAGAPDLDAMRLREAAEAVAMESVRRQAAAEAEARIRGHFLWGLATGSIDPMSDVANEASLLGYSPRAHYHVALLDVSEGDPAAVERRLLREGQHRQLRVHSARQGSRVLLLIGAVTDGESPAPDPMDRLLRVGGADSKSRATVAAGMALGCWQLTELATAYRDAERTLRVAQTVHGAHAIASASDLGPFLLLSRVAEDQQAREMARHALQPLLDYSRKRSPRLAETLDVYFEEDGNVSRTAKRLYLSRHSLLYRLEMIERLTGLSVRNRYDRLLLELSLTLLRFRVLESPDAIRPAAPAFLQSHDNSEAAHAAHRSVRK